MNDLLSVVRDPESSALPDLAMLRLLQLSSPALPIGAFAYSQGLEQATLLGWVKDETTAAHWIAGLVTEVLPRLDLPVLAESYAAWAASDLARVKQLSAFLPAANPESSAPKIATWVRPWRACCTAWA